MNGYAPVEMPVKRVNSRRKRSEDTLAAFMASDDQCIGKSWADYEENYPEVSRDMTCEANMLRNVIAAHGYDCHVTVRHNTLYIIKGERK